MSDPDYYRIAKEKVKKKKEFYSNLISWLIVSAFLFGLNLATSPEFIWAVFPFMGWGVGVFFHGLSVFSGPGFSRDWEEKEIQREMKRLKSRYGPEEEEDYLELDDMRQLSPKYKDSDFV